MANFAVRLVHGPGWDSSRRSRDQDSWDEHAAKALVDDRFLVLGEDEIVTRLADDPWGVGRAARDRLDRALGVLAGQPSAVTA